MHGHEANHGKTVRQNPPLSAGSAQDVRISNIVFINALPYALENGRKRRALPERFGNWSAVYARLRRWSRSGVLERLFAALRDQEAVGEDAPPATKPASWSATLG